jgi:hypothetical protein
MSELQFEHELQPGMPLPELSTRDELDRIEKAAYCEWYTSYGRQQYVDAANAIANEVAKVPDVQLLRSADYGNDYRNRCAHFALGEVLKEDWATPQSELPYELWFDSVRFLAAKGFEQTVSPSAGDLVGYAITEKQRPRGDEMHFLHYAIFEREGRAMSKLSQGPVIRHPIELIPSSYGNTAFFFRKTTV